MTAATIAVYGATGHTGRLVAAELAARDNDMVLAGRDAGALHALADERLGHLGARCGSPLWMTRPPCGRSPRTSP